MSGWEVNVPVLHWLWNNNIPHEGNRSMHNQTLALFSLFRWSASVVVFKALMHFLVHDALVFVHVDCLCFRDVSITSCILPLGEFDWFIRRNMKPVALRPFLYLSYRWCVFTLAYYFILQVEDHSNHAHNKPEKKNYKLVIAQEIHICKDFILHQKFDCDRVSCFLCLYFISRNTLVW